MKNLGTKIMRGPNYWSNYRKKLIVLTLDLKEWEFFPTNKINGFSQRLETLIPSLYTHECSEGCEGGFFHRVENGTWLGHVVEHVALEIQCLAGMECGFGRTRSADVPGVYHVVFSYEVEAAGLYAADAAIRIVESIAKNTPYDISKDIKELKEIKAEFSPGPSTAALIKEAEKRNIPYHRFNNTSLVAFGYCKNRKFIRASVTGSTSSIGVDIASNKEETKHILSQAYLPVPKGKLIYDVDELTDAINSIEFPIVIKPLDGNHGRGITTNITSMEKAIPAYHLARSISRSVIVEKFIEGADFRFLLVNFKVVAVAKRTPAMVMGNGISTVKQLIKEVNSDPRRGNGHEQVMTKIKINELSRRIIAKQNYTLSSVLPIGEILFLKDTANMSTGGTACDVTDDVHPQTMFMMERAARLLNLDICGVDVVAQDITAPLANSNGAIVEVNACPGLRMHLNPSKGTARNVAEPIMDMLFPKGQSATVPIIAVTGTNGKTTTTRLIAHLAMQEGYRTGYITTDGIYINGHAIHYGDCSGPKSAELILSEPDLDIAVLECARGGILKSGLGFSNCDISVITNVTEDHLGLHGINDVKEMGKVKGVVARSTHSHGYTILNADDDIVYEMRNDVDCNIALFSTRSGNKRIHEHCKKGGIAAIIEKDYLVICKGEWKTRIDKIKNLPITMNGNASCMIKNLLPSVLAAVIQGFHLDSIRSGLRSFIPSPELTPGRMNIFEFDGVKLMIDYAHNTDGLIQLKNFMASVKSPNKIGVITMAGDRRDEDFWNMGKIAAQIFDEIIIKHDEDLRGRTKEEMTSLLTEGIQSEKNIEPTVISDEKEAIDHALSTASKGSFITVLADKIFDVIEHVKNKRLKETELRPLKNTA
jgi:cyanophycin synthetase